ncbi:hypothetical protein L6R49_12165 [Myxococcota bacterium]|nr:hypothetical protein [Myxococcota bacterium]
MSVRTGWTVALIGAFALGCSLGGKGEDGRPSRDGRGDDPVDSEPAETEPPSWTWTPVLINFDELPKQIDVDEHYSEYLTFEVEDGNSMWAWDYASYSRSEPYTVYTTKSAGGAGDESDFVIRFTNPVRAFEFWLLGDQTDGPLAKITVTMEDGSTAEELMVGDGGSSSAERVDLSAYENVVSVEVYEIDDPYTVNFDDFSFEVRGE